MEEEKGEEGSSVKKVASACDVEALKKCLEENKGDHLKCQSHIEAFKSSCSFKKPNNNNSESTTTTTTAAAAA